MVAESREKDSAMDDPSTIKLSKGQCDELSHRLETNSLTAEDRVLLGRVLKAMLWLTSQLEAGRLGMRRLKRLLFGDKSEKRDRILKGKEPPWGETSDGTTNEESDDSVETNTSSEAQGKKTGSDSEIIPPKKNHGRRPTSDYSGAERVFCAHTNLKSGQRCPECQKGSLHESVDNGLFVRFSGNPPITAIVYETEKLRCSACGKIFEASLPEGVVAQRWDESAKTVTALLRYGYGFPHFRLEKMQADLGVPVADSVQFEHGNEIADCGNKVYQELVRFGASGQCLHSDDTTCRILDLMKENKKLDPEKDRVGIFTTAIISQVEEREITLFFSGRKHAGENMASLLAQRPAGAPPPILMVDGSASSKKFPKEFVVLLGNCLTHARRGFVDLIDRFPAEIEHVITEIGMIYHHDAIAREKALSAEARLAYHQQFSGPIIDALKAWCRDQIESKKTEPNSGLGKAIRYMERRWPELTLFLRVPGAPLSNDIVERLIKRCVLHRKNSLFFKTQHGAVVGDILMTLIHTTVRAGKNPFHYLTALQLHRSKVHKNPAAWLPWSYETTLAALQSKP